MSRNKQASYENKILKLIFIFRQLWGWSGTESTVTEAITGLLYQPWKTDDDDCPAISGMNE
jgi:hypothetical protein